MSLVLSGISIVIISKVVISNFIIGIVAISLKDIMRTQTTRTLPKHDDVSATVVTATKAEHIKKKIGNTAIKNAKLGGLG